MEAVAAVLWFGFVVFNAALVWAFVFFLRYGLRDMHQRGSPKAARVALVLLIFVPPPFFVALAFYYFDKWRRPGALSV